MSIQQLCPYQAFLVQNALLCTLKADTPEFSTTSIFVNTAKGNGGLCAWKWFGCHYGQLGIGFNWFLDRKVIWTGKRGDEELIGGVRRVSSVGTGVECECEDVALTVGTTILFRRRHSRNVKLASEKCWPHTTFQVCALYSTPDCLPTAQPCT